MSSLSGRRDWTGSQSAQLTRQRETSANTVCCYYHQNKISSGLTTTEEAWPPPPTLWSPASRSHLWSVHCQVVLGDWGGLVCVLQTRQEHGDRVFNSKGRSYQMSGDNYLGSPCIRFFLQGNWSLQRTQSSLLSPLHMRSCSVFGPSVIFDALTHNSLQLTGDSVQNCCCHQWSIFLLDIRDELSLLHCTWGTLMLWTLTQISAGTLPLVTTGRSAASPSSCRDTAASHGRSSASCP